MDETASDAAARQDAAADGSVRRGWRSTSRASCSSISPDGTGARGWTDEGTAVFVDISGFTKLSERSPRRGAKAPSRSPTSSAARFDVDPERRVRRRRQPAQVRRRRPAAVVPGRSPPRARVPRDDRDARRRSRRRPHRAARRRGHAADVAGRAHRRVPFLRGRRVAHRVPPVGPGLDAARRDGNGGDRRRDPAVSPEAAAALPRELPRRRQGIRACCSRRCRGEPRHDCRASRGRRVDAATLARCLPPAIRAHVRRRRRAPPSTVRSRSRSCGSRGPTR